jgi:F0F1-type ATP synthase membrane subunit c/vacuolar-type H+-ATPase subunit K
VSLLTSVATKLRCWRVLILGLALIESLALYTLVIVFIKVV